MTAETSRQQVYAAQLQRGVPSLTRPAIYRAPGRGLQLHGGERQLAEYEQGPGAKRVRQGRAQRLPNCSSSKNLFTGFLVDFGRPARERRTGRGLPERDERVREWQGMLEAGEVASRAELARRVGVSRARVTQVLRKPQ